MCQEWGVLYVGTLRTLRVPEQVLGRHGHSWHIESTWFTLRNIPWKFRLNILLFDYDTGSWIWPLKSVFCVGSGISVHCGSSFGETPRFWWFYHILCVVWRPIRKHLTNFFSIPGLCPVGSVISVHCGPSFRETPRFWRISIEQWVVWSVCTVDLVSERPQIFMNLLCGVLSVQCGVLSEKHLSKKIVVPIHWPLGVWSVYTVDPFWERPPDFNKYIMCSVSNTEAYQQNLSPNLFSPWENTSPKKNQPLRKTCLSNFFSPWEKYLWKFYQWRVWSVYTVDLVSERPPDFGEYQWNSGKCDQWALWI